MSDTAILSHETAAPKAHHVAAHAVTQAPRRRLQPRIWDTDWLVLCGMAAVIEPMAARLSKPGAVAIDFGCGTKPYEPVFTANGVRYAGADFDAGADIVIAQDGTMAAAEASADLVLSFQVLEHVRSLDTYLGEARRVLKPDGTLLLSTHGVWLYHPHPEDHRRWTRTGLVTDIEARGFEVTECKAVVGPLAWTTMVRLTCLAVALRKLPIVGGPLAALAATVMNARAWVEDKITPAWVTNDNASVYVVLAKPVAQK